MIRWSWNKSLSNFFVFVFVFQFLNLFSFLFSTSLFAKPTKIGFLLSTMQEERYQKDKRFFEAEAKRLGAEVLFDAANNSERTQASKMENMLMQKVDAVVIQPVNSAAASNLVSMAQEAKIPVIAYDRMILNAPIDLYVTMDSREVGRLQAEAAVKATGGKGNFLILMGQSGHSVANEITAGVKEVLKKYPQINIVIEKNHESWSATEALSTTENILTKYKGQIQAVLANNSGMANGAVQAINDFDKKLVGKIFVAGADADLTAIKNMVKGEQQFEVLKDIKLLAEKSVQVALSLARHEKILLSTEMISNGKFKIPVVKTPVFPVTKDSIDEVVVKRGFHSREAIYGHSGAHPGKQ